ncbi:MAG: cytochrome c biogenesis protein CcsA [Myxococcales bacterium]|nr:cytochrome c biogenesis protein CcsA [Myxococcales bacterium]
MSRAATNALKTVAGLAIALTAASIYLIFFVAPAEEQMGIVQKIFYFHVPSAFAMYIGFGCAALGSVMYLVRRSDGWDALAVAGAEVGMLFCLIVLTTGPLWARKAWGHFWTWDPRLTTTLLGALIFAAYLALRSSGDAGEAERRFAAGLAVLALPNLFLIHYSVQRWRGTHPTVITKGGGGLAPQMVPPFICSVVAFTLLAIWLLALRVRMERQHQRASALTMDALRLGLGEDDPCD